MSRRRPIPACCNGSRQPTSVQKRLLTCLPSRPGGSTRATPRAGHRAASRPRPPGRRVATRRPRGSATAIRRRRCLREQRGSVFVSSYVAARDLAEAQSLDVEPTHLVEAARHPLAVPVDDRVGVEEAHDRVEVLRAVRLLGHADESPRSRLGHEPQQLTRELDGGSHVHRIDVDAEHSDCASAFHALGCVVQEDDDARIDAHRLGCSEIGLGCGLAHADVRRVDEGVEVAELGPALEELGTVDRIGIVREDTDALSRSLRGAA